MVAHPDDESFALGAVLDAFARSGAEVSVLCLTRGEASTLHGVSGELGEIREAELAAAAAELGITSVRLRDYPDGGLDRVEHGRLEGEVHSAVTEANPDGLLVFDPDGVTGHGDHRCATAVALRVGEGVALPVLAWTLPTRVAATLREEFDIPFAGHSDGEIDIVLPVDRTAQRRAVDCHPSQAVPGSALWRRLELLGDHEHLRWLLASPA
ncbi:MAG: PIG-L family deacetylase [Actinomycetales bacterium]|nr:PIG-L family deacetylase [Actinomycetales bacterium]